MLMSRAEGAKAALGQGSHPATRSMIVEHLAKPHRRRFFEVWSHLARDTPQILEARTIHMEIAWRSRVRPGPGERPQWCRTQVANGLTTVLVPQISQSG